MSSTCPVCKNVQSFHNHDVRATDDHLLIGAVIDQVGVHGRSNLVCTALDLSHEPDKPASVIRFGKSLAVHDPATFQHCVGPQEPIGGDKVDLGMVGPATQQCLKHAGRGGLPEPRPSLQYL